MLFDLDPALIGCSAASLRLRAAGDPGELRAGELPAAPAEPGAGLLLSW